MTKKHYEAIARILLQARTNSTPAQHIMVDVIIDGIVRYFESDNPRFDRVRFLKACGVEQEVWCDICDNEHATDTLHCEKHNKTHKVCSMCRDNGHMPE